MLNLLALSLTAGCFANNTGLRAYQALRLPMILQDANHKSESRVPCLLGWSRCGRSLHITFVRSFGSPAQRSHCRPDADPCRSGSVRPRPLRPRHRRGSIRASVTRTGEDALNSSRTYSMTPRCRTGAKQHDSAGAYRRLHLRLIDLDHGLALQPPADRRDPYPYRPPLEPRV